MAGTDPKFQSVPESLLGRVMQQGWEHGGRARGMGQGRSTGTGRGFAGRLLLRASYCL